MNYTDFELVAEIKKGDQKAASYLYKNYKQLVLGVLNKIDKSRRIDHDDLYQDVVSAVVVNIQRGKLDALKSKLSTFIYKVAYNHGLYLIRGYKTNESIDEGILDVEQSHEDDIDKEELIEKTLELVKSLKPPCDEILIDWYINDLSFEVIAIKHKYANANMAKKGECIAKARDKGNDLLTD